LYLDLKIWFSWIPPGKLWSVLSNMLFISSTFFTVHYSFLNSSAVIKKIKDFRTENISLAKIDIRDRWMD
jgi:hypothetical protein